MKLRIALAPCSAMLVLLILSGCAGNPFKKFYQHMPDANALLERRVNPASASIDMYQHTERKDASVRFGGVQYRRHDGSRRHGSSARQGGAMRCAMTDREYTDFSDGVWDDRAPAQSSAPCALRARELISRVTDPRPARH